MTCKSNIIETIKTGPLSLAMNLVALFFALVYCRSGKVEMKVGMWAMEAVVVFLTIAPAAAVFPRSSLVAIPPPLNLTILYEVLCPDCMKLFTKQLSKFVPSVGRFVHIQLLPYGNARRAAAFGPDRFECQHGLQECAMNMFHSCAIHVLNQEVRSLQFILCLEEGHWKKLEDRYTLAVCLQAGQVSRQEQWRIGKCMVNGEGLQLQERMAIMTENVWPERHTFVPWVVINGVSTKAMQSQQNHLFQLFCLWYYQQAFIRPPGC